MFKDARAQDRQRTAASFTRALDRYAAHTEDWFDGGVGSIDRRLAHCDRLLHTAGATVSRMGMTPASARYLGAIEQLTADRRVLLSMKEDLLTGAANREERSDFEKGEGTFSPWRDEAQDDENSRWHDDYVREHGKKACNDFDSDHHPKVPKTKLDKKQKLSGTDARWVTLEAARFVAANASTCDDPHELATRAQHHAAVKTSTFTPQRSAEICAAFVAEVGELSSAAPAPMTVRTAALDTDWDASYMYLC